MPPWLGAMINRTSDIILKDSMPAGWANIGFRKHGLMGPFRGPVACFGRHFEVSTGVSCMVDLFADPEQSLRNSVFLVGNMRYRWHGCLRQFTERAAEGSHVHPGQSVSGRCGMRHLAVQLPHPLHQATIPSRTTTAPHRGPGRCGSMRDARARD